VEQLAENRRVWFEEIASSAQIEHAIRSRRRP
jgi:hypothetical protein